MRSHNNLQRREHLDRVFLSHAHADSAVAKEVASLIKRVTLNRIDVWYSSDDLATGGIGVGEQWLNSILTSLRLSRAVITLVTPQSVNRPWIHFESGLGAARALDVIPVCVGVDDIAGVPAPLNIYKAYQLSDLSSLNLLLGKLLHKFGVPFDEEMAKAAAEPALRKILDAVSHQRATEAPAPQPSPEDLLMQVKDHIDRRLAEIGTARRGKNAEYSVPLRIEFPGRKVDDFLKVSPRDTVADRLDAIWYRIRDQVPPYTYLQRWIVRDLSSNEKLVMREVQERVPAQVIFRPGTSWEVTLLARPYAANSDPSSQETPASPEIQNPDTAELLKRMKKVDPAQARRYRQRTGE